ncbi:competence type IV pilus assembly protein ComGB [Enterococcus faecalis]
MVLFQTKFFTKSKIKLSKIEQHLFIQLMADLMNNGFTMQESFLFMEKTQLIKKSTLSFLTKELVAGSPLDQLMLRLGFSQLIAVQIALAAMHGDLGNTLAEIYHYLQEVQSQRQAFYKVISYPLLLLFFLLMVMFGMRQFLLPQLLPTTTDSNAKLGLSFIQKAPQFLLASILIVFLSVWLSRWYLSKRTALQRSFTYMKWPLFCRFYQLYVSTFFALEWGKLFAQGLETKTVILLMAATSSHPLMKELAQKLETSLLSGQALFHAIRSYPFFTKELSLIIQRGEVKGKLGKELLLYSKVSLARFFKKIDGVIRWVQPLVFIIIALLIIVIYGAMLLPIYGNMEGVLN